MTIDERFERIEHVTAALAEERRKDREEYKALWRDTQRQLDLLAERSAISERHIGELAVETRLRLEQLADENRKLADENRATNERLDKLVSAVGALTQLIPPRQ